jgi:hypothetical protein
VGSVDGHALRTHQHRVSQRKPSLAPSAAHALTRDEGEIVDFNGHGQAMMSTATAFTSAYARRGSGPSSHDMMKVTIAIAMTAA